MLGCRSDLIDIGFSHLSCTGISEDTYTYAPTAAAAANSARADPSHTINMLSMTQMDGWQPKSH